MTIRLIILFLLIYQVPFAQGNRQVYFKLGTTGIGLGYEQELSTKLSLKSSISYINLASSYLYKGRDNQHRLKAQFDFAQLELAAKCYPKAKTTGYGISTSNRFFLEGGVLIRNTGDYLFYSDYQKLKPGNQFDNSDTLTGRLNFKLETNIIQPFLGLGYEILPKDSRWSATIEGALSYHGTSPAVPFENFYETGKIKQYEKQF